MYTELATLQQDYMSTFVTNKSYSFMKIICNSMQQNQWQWLQDVSATKAFVNRVQNIFAHDQFTRYEQSSNEPLWYQLYALCW